MANNLVPIPIDADGSPVQTVPARTALAVTVDSSISASTEVVLNAATTFIEVHALAKGIYLAWGADDASTSNFDEYIGAGLSRYYYVPKGVTAVNFIEQAASATLILIEK